MLSAAAAFDLRKSHLQLRKSREDVEFPAWHRQRERERERILGSSGKPSSLDETGC